MKQTSILISFLAIVNFIQGQSTIPFGKEINLTHTGFYENKGQLTDQNYKPNPGVKYLLSSPGFNVQLRQTGFSYDTYTDTFDSAKDSKSSMTAMEGKFQQPKKFTRHYHRVDIELVDCNPHTQLITEGKSAAYYNYLTTEAPKGGVSGVNYYSRITYKDIYPHIDLEFMASDGKKPVEYNFIVHDGGNLADIKLSYKGANKVNLKNNNLVVSVSTGDFSESIPSSYLAYNKQPVKVIYTALGNNTYSFSVPNSPVPNSSDLVIDPTPNLAWGTYLGAEPNPDQGEGITTDASGNVYVVGYVGETGLATAGAYMATSAGSADIFVAKLNPSLSGTAQLVWYTYYGGAGYDVGCAIALGASNNIYITGYTESTSGIATPGAYLGTNSAGNTGYAAFAAEFNSAGTSLLWGTYYGTTGINNCYGITLDALDNVYVIGSTQSNSGIATPGAYQTTFGSGTTDAFVAKFNPSVSGSAQLVWGTYYGITNTTYGQGITLDASDDVYITGNTTSASGIATTGAYQGTVNGGSDVFVGEFNPTGSTLLRGTYYGGTSNDEGYGIALDASDNMYITGSTFSSSGIATPGAYQAAYGGFWDIFVAEFSPTAAPATGITLDWGTYYGGTKEDQATGIILDASDNIYIVGSSQSTSGIATPGAYQTSLVGTGYDIIVAKFSPAGALDWGTYYGGTGLNYSGNGNAVALDPCDNVYITGEAGGSGSGITTPGAYQTTWVGPNYEVLVAKFNPSSTSAPLTVAGNVISNVLCNEGNTGSASASANGGTPPYTYSWAPSGGSAGNATGLTAGTYTITVTDACGNSVTASATITTPPAIRDSVSVVNTACGGATGSATAGIKGGTSPYTYLWSPGGQTNATATGLNVGVYTVTATDNNGCSQTASGTILQNSPITATVSSTGLECNGGNDGTATVTPSGGAVPYTYLWSPGGQANITATGLTAGNYTVTVTDNNGCYQTASITITQANSITVTASGTSAGCNGNNDGTATANQNGGTSPYTYSWSLGGQGNATATGLGAGTYTVTVTDNNGCSQTALVTITQATSITITASGTSIGCSGGSDGTATAVLDGGTSPFTFYWSPGGQTNATATGLGAGTYMVTTTDASGCSSSATAIITNPSIQALIAFSSNILQGCSPLCIQFNNLTPVNPANSPSYVWSFGNGDTSHTQNPVYCYPSGGIYSVGLTVTVDGGCSATLNKINMITVYSQPDAAFSISPQPVTILSPTIQFTNQSTDPYEIIQWWWTFGDQTDSVSTQQNPAHTYQDTGTYCATLVVTDLNGCADTVTNCLAIEPLFTLYIPDAFTPNGDGLNDIFMAKGQYVKSFEMYIFDRWGQELFHSTTINDGWNGTVKGNSTVCQEDIYVYKILATDYENKQHSYVGNITLLK